MRTISYIDVGFSYIDVGATGRDSDGGVFYSSDLGKALRNCELNIPEPARLPHSEMNFDYYFVGDEAFPLSMNMKRPYPGRGSISNLPQDEKIFNYRLSR